MNKTTRAQIVKKMKDYTKKLPLNELAAHYGTPLLILDLDRLASQYRTLQTTFPGVRFYYALKALSHIDAVRTIAKNDGYMDVATSREITLALQGGMQPERLMHTHPIKKPADIDSAYLAGVRTFVIDNLPELRKFVGRPNDIKLLIRLSYQNPGAKSDLSYKFGASPEGAETLLQTALDHNLTIAGFSLHVGSQIHSADAYHVALTQTIALMCKLEKQHDIAFSILNIGGGFPIGYRSDVPTIQEIADIINPIIEPLQNKYAIYAEPGRFVAAPAVTALTSVVGVSQRQGKPWYYLDDGLYGSYGLVIWEDTHPAIISRRELDGDNLNLEPCILAGPTCDSVDIIAKDYPLPRLQPGDLLMSPNMGAYTVATATEFNSIPKACIIVINSALGQSPFRVPCTHAA